MQEFLVIVFNEKQDKIDELVRYLHEMKNEGRYASCDMKNFSFHSDVSKIITISNASMDLGRSISDRGFNIRHRVWKSL